MGQGSTPEVLGLPGHIDVPGPVGRGWTFVRGWAIGGSESSVSCVEVFVDERPVGRAGLFRLRSDVAAALKRADAELSGFELAVDLSQVEPDRHRIWIDVTVTMDNQEQITLRPVEVVVTHEAIPLPSLLKSAAPMMVGTHHRRGLPLRVLCMARSLDRGGSQLRLVDLVRYLASTRRFDVHILAAADGPLRSDLEAARAVVHLRESLPLDDEVAYDERLSELVGWATGRFDLIMGSTLTEFSAVELAVRLGLPSVWRIGEVEPLNTVVGWLGGQLDPAIDVRAQRCYGAASVVVFNSDTGLQRHQGFGATGRFVVLGDGTDTTGARAYAQSMEREEARRVLGIGNDRRVLVSAATFWPVKGPALIISAFAHVRATHPDLECVLIGQRYGEYPDAIARLIQRLNLSNSVRVLEYRSDLSIWWRAADAVICASESESLPATVLEGMAFGLPVVGTRVGDVPKIVKDDVTGWLCSPCDVSSLIEGMSQMASATDERLRYMGARGARYVQRYHDRQRSLKRMTAVMEGASSPS